MVKRRVQRVKRRWGRRSLKKQALAGAALAVPGYAVGIPAAIAGGFVENPTGIPFGDRFKYTNPARMSRRIGHFSRKINRVRNAALAPAAVGSILVAQAGYAAYKKRFKNKRKRKR